MLPVIQSLWIGPDLSNVEKLCVKSFLDHGHEFHLYTYAHVGGVPEGAIIKDANEILPEYEVFYNRGGGVAAFSDWFRYALLNKRGNFWVDMDVVCIKPFLFDSDIVFGRGMEGNVFGSSVIALPKGHVLAQSLEKAGRKHTENFPWEDLTVRKKKLKKRLFRRGKDGMEFDNPIAPGGLSQAIKYFSLSHYAKPFMYFSPINYSLWQSAFNDVYSEGIEFYENTYAVHLWNEMAGRMPGFDKNARFDETSLFESLKKKHHIENDESAPKISSTDIQTMFLMEKKRRKNKKHYRNILIMLVLFAMFIFGWVAGKYAV